MAIPISFQQRCAFHFTSIDNLPSILAHGLLANTALSHLGLAHTTFNWEIPRVYRSGFPIPQRPGETADDYVPLYFCKLSPMLLMILNNKTIDEEEIIHFEFPIQVMEPVSALFTNAAIFPGSAPNFYDQPSALDRLNWDAIDSTARRMPNLTLRMARLAELLIPGRLPLSSARRIIVWDEAVAKKVERQLQDARLFIPVEADPGCYFIDPDPGTPGGDPIPAVFGPRQIARIYEQTRSAIKNAAPVPSHGRFKTLDDLRQALWNDLACLPETGELVGLETDNLAHKEDVGSHTRRVVTEITRTDEYLRMDSRHRVILEVAAFLHDIGKGPRSRWKANNGRQQIDFNHPVGALPMVARILTREVKEVSFEDARLICLLVAYHDIIGGILFSARRKVELLNVAHTLDEIDLLMAISKADALAINPSWGETLPRERFREQIKKEIGE